MACGQSYSIFPWRKFLEYAINSMNKSPASFDTVGVFLSHYSFKREPSRCGGAQIRGVALSKRSVSDRFGVRVLPGKPETMRGGTHLDYQVQKSPIERRWRGMRILFSGTD